MVRKHLKNIHPTVDNGNANRFSSVLPFHTPPDWGGGIKLDNDKYWWKVG